MNSSDNALLVDALPTSQYVPTEGVELNFWLDNSIKRISTAVNAKESALYPLREIGCFKSYFTTGTPFVYRNVYRFLVDVVDENGGNLVATTTYAIPHGITGITDPILLSGTATDDTGRFLPIPFVSTTATDNIQLHATATNIVVTMGATSPTLTQCYVLFEYTKN